ncbi:MAG: S8 family serine peptidase [Arcobacteraceae bacterium]|nr:S8 family serine peptidase [Arcobacteraceae bacterium]
MKLTKFINYSFLLFLNFFIVACGGGGGGGGGGGSSPSLLSGIFIDSAVEGLTYQTATQSGKTNSSGTFNYYSGESISFYIGNVLIGTTSSKSSINPIDLVANGDIDNATVINIARVLQTFDSDKNTSNGITLVSAAQNLDLNITIDFSQDSNITFLISDVNTSEGGTLVEINASDAKAHLSITLSLPTDNDNDYIPDDIETSIGMDNSIQDENTNSIIDGFDTAGSFGDPNFGNQWFIRLNASIGLDLDNTYKKYMGYNSGTNIIAQIVDTGVETTHEDLAANMDLTKSRNAINSTNGGTTDTNGHGTRCAGILGARAFNGKGVRGVAPFIKIVGNNWLENQTASELEKAWLTGDGASTIAVSSNSWGSCYSTSTVEEDILAQGTSILRDGKGRNYVMAAGNERTGDESCPHNSNPASANMSYSANNQYVITVAALGKDNIYANYSNQGSNILVSAYGGDSDDGEYIYTTALSNTYTDSMSGTSAATPMVAGGVALLLEACPTLTYRDVKYLIAKNATQIDIGNSTWEQNSAGLWHSIDYGYGLLNVEDMITMCQNNYTNLGTVNTSNDTQAVNNTVPNNDANGLSISINVATSKTVEWVGVWLDMTFDDIGDVEFTLESPAGTVTKLLHSDNALGNTDISGEYRLSSVAFVDENSAGNWIVKVADKNINNQTNRTINSIKIQIVGH